MQRKHIYLLIAAAVAAIVTLALGRLVNHPAERPKAAASAPADSPSSKEHELKALSVELEKKPNHPPILMRMAQLSRELGKPEEAIAHLRQLTKTEPNNMEGHLELGRALYESNDIPGAIEETNRV